MAQSRRNNSGTGEYEGVKGTKSPTGSRPAGKIAKNHPPEPVVPGPLAAKPYEQTASHAVAGGTRQAPTPRTKHPTPNRDRLTGRSKSEGGGSY